MEKNLSPEEHELLQKRTELSALTAELADAELELVSLRSRLEEFEREYHRQIGNRYAELDLWEAKIATALAKQKPDFPHFRELAEKAQARARASAEQAKQSAAGPARPAASEEAKKLYRQAAKLIHPDLAVSDADRQRRDKKMVELNAALAAGDVESIRQILADWKSSPEDVIGEGIAAELVRVIRQIHQARRRLAAVGAETELLQSSENAKLLKEFELARAMGRDLIVELAAELEAMILNAKKRYDQVEAG